MKLKLTLLFCVLLATPAGAQYSVCATVPELGDLAKQVGGDRIRVTTFAKGAEDPHFVVPRPTFIRDLARADALVLVGLQLEIGWLPPLLRNSRNRVIQIRGPAYIDASRAVTAMLVPKGRISRSQGDVHPGGNPHFLVSPIHGLKVARLIKLRFSQLWPDDAEYFETRFQNFSQRFAQLYLGEELANKYRDTQLDKLTLLNSAGRMDEYLESQGELSKLGGWLGMLRPFRGTPLVDDHQMWPYFARTLGFKMLGHLEPQPGMQPTPRHLATVIQLIRTKRVKVILANAYYDPRHARFVEANTNATVARMAHQVQARPTTETFLKMCNYNVHELVRMLRRTASQNARPMP